MNGRYVTLACALLLILVAILPGQARAAGVPLRGQQINSSTWKLGSTGDCVCDIQWYTVGLRPGTVTIFANLLYTTLNRGPTYGLEVWFDRGNSIVQFGQASCSKAKRICNQKIRLTARITHAGIYYLKLKGPGAEGTSYSLRVQGNIYPLHCHKTC